MHLKDRQELDTPASAFWPGLPLLLQFQQQQWLGLLAWQQSMLTIQQDLYDQWLSRWADGARLDD